MIKRHQKITDAQKLKAADEEDYSGSCSEGSSSSADSNSDCSSATSDGEQSDTQTTVTADAGLDARSKVLIIPSRGIGHRFRHFMLDLHALMPNSKKENKLDTKKQLTLINEVCDLEGCDTALFFESRKHEDLYLWISNVTADGPSAKFHVQNVHTAEEVNLKGNCMRRSRAIVSFAPEFDDDAFPHLRVAKNLLTAAFAVPEQHKKINRYYDHVISFSFVDDRIWFRNYEIVEEAAEKVSNVNVSLREIGPRFCMQPIKMFQNSFCGPVIYSNDAFKSPNEMRAAIRREQSLRYVNRTSSQMVREEARASLQISEDELDVMFK